MLTKMEQLWLWLSFLLVGMTIAGGCMSQPTEHMQIERRIALSPSHPIMPKAIIRASNGDLIVFGANAVGSRAWATRISPSGKVQWEFIDGGVEEWDNSNPRGQQFFGAVELPNEATMLCGVKVVNNIGFVTLVSIGKDGAVLSEKLLPRIREGTVLSGVNCHKWGDGIALLGGVSGQPAGTGWMAKLDMNLNVQWKKFSDDYAPGEISDSGRNLYVLGWQDQDYYVVKLGSEGEIVAKQLLPAGEHHLVQTEANDSVVRVVTMLSTLHTEITKFGVDLGSPLHTLKLSNVGVKKCLALPDETIAIFGSQFNNQATATVTRVYKNGGHKTFVVEPLYQSPWYIAAVLTGNGSEVAAVRQIGPLQSVVELISFK